MIKVCLCFARNKKLHTETLALCTLLSKQTYFILKFGSLTLITIVLINLFISNPYPISVNHMSHCDVF